MKIIYKDGGTLTCCERIILSGNDIIVDDIYTASLDDIEEIIEDN